VRRVHRWIQIGTPAKTLQPPEMLIVSGIAARWFPQVDVDIAKARVYRFD
jgi:hypothetical protein